MSNFKLLCGLCLYQSHNTLSIEAKKNEVAVTGFAVDPYVIDGVEWTREPETIPQLRND